MGFLTELQSRIPDRWYFRRLLPAAVYVVLVVIGGHQLGRAHWGDPTRAPARLAAEFRADGGSAPRAVASLILFAVAVALCAFAVPVAAAAIEALVRGAWPWWLTPLGSGLVRLRLRFWKSADEHKNKALNHKDKSGQWHRAREARFNSLKEKPSIKPRRYTWSADRLDVTRQSIEFTTGLRIDKRWTDLMLLMPDSAQAILTTARDSYDAACEALVWSVALLVLGFFWPPAFVAGFLLGLVSWRWLRQSVAGLCDTAEAAARVYGRQVTGQAPE